MFSGRKHRTSRGWWWVAAALVTVVPVLAVDVSPPPILQWFDSSYRTIEERIPDLFLAGYGFVWVPPPFRADSGDTSVGYDVYDRFDLGRPGRPTTYGTEEGLKALSRMLHRAGLSLHVDFVMNHNGFSNLGTAGFAAAGGYPGFAITLPNDVDGDFHSAFAGGPEYERLAGPDRYRAREESPVHSQPGHTRGPAQFARRDHSEIRPVGERARPQ